jgi:tripartite ATP-independent transporter DctM subunit
LSEAITTFVIWAGLFSLLITGLPIAFCLMIISVMGFLVFIGPQALYTVFPPIFDSLVKDVYLAIPLFVFMASILEISGIGVRMYDMMYKWMAGIKGGLAMGTVVICTLIAAMTGLSGTGTLIMGMLAYPEMMKRGYNKKLAMGSIMGGGMLGPLIPPSLPMIITAGLTGISVGKIFMAGMFPGLICSLFFMAYIGVRCVHKPSLGPAIPLTERANWREKITSLLGLLLPIFLITLVLGGIYSGACTPTEAGAVGASGALICAAIYRTLNWRNLYSVVTKSFGLIIMCFWLVLGGSSFSALCGFVGVNRFITDLIITLKVSPIGIVAVMMFIIFVMGMFMETAAILLIVVPVFMPIAVKLGIDLLWICFLITMCAIIGMLTPPFGYILFYFKGIGYKDVSITDIYLSVWGFIWISLIVLVLCILFPEIVLWLPRMTV